MNRSEEPVPEQGDAAATRRPVNRRFQAIASVLILLAALGLWGASRMKWATVLVGEDPPYPSREVTVTGSDWSPWLVAVALAMVAAVVAQFAVRGLLLRGVAILVALGGAVSVIPAISLLTEGEGNLYVVKMAGVSDRSPVVGIPVESMPGYLVIVSAICAVLGAVFMMRTANQGGMSSKYDSPAARREELERKVFAERERAAAAGEPAATETNERLLWDSLDEGIDPTDDEK
ncbi:TIGR02234 family membrane protein [Gordonia hydrophobica]|uniref:TIGR02234 family membrane protein n=1 Tax=Gordonia hydrophobica TaxID=40516 RepID=A0ABZ2U0W9_9ACTN|nr:TIGR02234 family membrane protein [Gordonia hydrophobica]MBM7367177.1 putative membrane protein (TIGR02234 family) [Gordonia hydrophobica]